MGKKVIRFPRRMANKESEVAINDNLYNEIMKF